MSEALAYISPSVPRRVIGVGMLGGLGVLLVLLALFRPPESFLLRIFLIALGAGALALTDLLRRATGQMLILTETELREENGRVLAQVADIEAVDRGVFAFKSANGFNLKTRRPGGFVWAPGLWWRIGRRVGVGGVISKTEGRFMADTISALLSERA